MFRKLIPLGAALLLAACGTVATPVYEAPPTDVPASGQATAVVPTATVTPVPPTPTFTPEPPTPTPVPTEAPTEAPSAPETSEATGVAAEDDPLAFFIQLASAANGEQLFYQPIEVDGVPWACSTCHSAEDEETRIGPGLLHIGQRAGSRVEGEGPYTYIFNSIYNSELYIVPGFEAGTQMPHFGPTDTRGAVLTNAQIYDLVAYLMTLE